MPNAANFSINNGAATPVSVLFTNLQPAGGNLPAVYLAKTTGPMVSAQAKIAVSSTGTAKTREVRITVRTPYWVTGTDGVTKVLDSCFSEIRTVLPESVPDDVRANHVAYVANSCGDAQIKDALRNGYAPT